MTQQFNRKHGTSKREFQANQKVYARMYGAERTWVPAVVKSEKGNRIYELATVSGQSLTRHANQLWVYHGDTKASDNDKHHVTSNTKSLKPRRRQILCCLVFGREHDVKEPPWRLTRVKKPVQRLMMQPNKNLYN